MILELFPCSGGMAEGFRRAGLAPDLAIEWDADACDSYEENHEHRPVHMDVRDFLRLVEAGFTRPVDLIVADPPCTPWSRAGKRLGTADERDMLLVTVEIIRLLRPRAYLIGNVHGLADAPNWPSLQRALAPLGSAGYCIADFATLDAANYGVPQHRIRPFWYGHFGGPCIQWPAPTHGDPDDPSVHSPLPGLALTSWVTCRDALGHLPPEQLGKPVRLRERACNGKQHGSVADKPALGVGTSNLSDGNVLVRSRPFHNPHPVSDADEPARTLTTKQREGGGGGAATMRVRTPQSQRGQDASQPARTIRATRTWGAGQLINAPDAPSYTVTAKGDGRGAQGAAVLEWPWDRPATTLGVDERIPPPGHHAEYSIQSMPNAVRLSERAAAILQGFPEGWTFSGKTKSSRWSQIGQAMPPALAEAVARAVKRAMEES